MPNSVTGKRPTNPPEEVALQRQATANRILTILKTALNRAYSDDKVTSDEAWRKVKPFRGVDAARIRYLTDAESQRLVNACNPAFRPMVRAALLVDAIVMPGSGKEPHWDESAR